VRDRLFFKKINPPNPWNHPGETEEVWGEDASVHVCKHECMIAFGVRVLVSEHACVSA